MVDLRTRAEAEEELERTLAAVKLGIWKPPEPEPAQLEPEPTPTLHAFASAWVERNRGGVDARTVEFWTWAPSHVLEHLAELPVSEVTAERVDTYKTAKLRERELLLEELRRWQVADPESRGGPRPPRPLSNGSINRTLRVLSQVCDDVVEYGYLSSNPARGRKRRLKAAKPRRTWLELDEVRAILDAAGEHRALLATMLLGGLRVGELCQLRWHAVDLARGILRVEDGKTDASLVFPTRPGTPRDRSNVRTRVLERAIERANRKLAEAGRGPVQEGVTNHTRRTFASLLYEAGASPAYVMSQLGHTSSSLALEVYAKKMERERDTGARIDALIRAADWAQTGTSGAGELAALPIPETKEAA